MQVLTIIVQNSVAYADLGVATSGVTFFRTMGSVVRRRGLRHALRQPAQAHAGRGHRDHGTDPTQVTTPEAVKTLPADQHAAVVHAYAESLQSVFPSAIPVAVLALLVALFLKQVPMRG